LTHLRANKNTTKITKNVRRPIQKIYQLPNTIINGYIDARYPNNSIG